MVSDRQAGYREHWLAVYCLAAVWLWAGYFTSLIGSSAVRDDDKPALWGYGETRMRHIQGNAVSVSYL